MACQASMNNTASNSTNVSGKGAANPGVGASGFSFYMPVERHPIPAPQPSRGNDATYRAYEKQNHARYSSSSNFGNHDYDGAQKHAGNVGMSASGDWSMPNWTPSKKPRSSTVPPPLKLGNNYDTNKPQKDAGLCPNFAQNNFNKDSHFTEPNFYNGYYRNGNNQNDVLIPKYSSAGPSNGHGRNTVLTGNAKPVPGGFRGYSETGNKITRTPPMVGRVENQIMSTSEAATKNNESKTFEQYQNDVMKRNSIQSKISKKPFNFEDLPVNPLPCLVVLSVTIETMNRLLGRTPKTDVLFEFYGILDSPVNYLAALKAKKFTLRQGRSYINCIFFETDKLMSKVVRNHYMRCVGKWNIKLRSVVAYSARHAKQEEARKATTRIELHEPELEKYFS